MFHFWTKSPMNRANAFMHTPAGGQSVKSWRQPFNFDRINFPPAGTSHRQGDLTRAIYGDRRKAKQLMLNGITHAVHKSGLYDRHTKSNPYWKVDLLCVLGECGNIRPSFQSLQRRPTELNLELAENFASKLKLTLPGLLQIERIPDQAVEEYYGKYMKEIGWPVRRDQWGRLLLKDAKDIRHFLFAGILAELFGELSTRQP